MQREWTERQRKFGFGGFTEEPESPIEVYEENGKLIKRYRSMPAFGVGCFNNVRPTTRAL